MIADQDLALALETPIDGEGPYDIAEHFWLRYPFYSEQFAAEVTKRYQEHIDEWEGSAVASAIWNAYRAYHNLGSSNDDPLTQLQSAGEAGELLSLAIPHYRSLVRHQIALFTAERPAWDPQARTSDAASAKQVPMAANLLDFISAGGVLDKRLGEQVEMMMTAGAGYYISGWDPNTGYEGRGWFTEKVCAPWELCHEKVRCYDDATWWIHRDFVSRWDWVAHYADADPEKAKKLAETSGSADGFSTAYMDNTESISSTGDRIAVLHCIARPTKACPEGRYTIVTEDLIVLLDGPYPFGEDVTISRMCASEFLGTSIPFCDSWGVLAAADAFNAIISMIMTRIDTCGVPNFCVPDGSELEYSDIAGGNAVWKLPPGSEKPAVIDMLQVPQALPAVLELLSGEMEKTVGINSVTRGQPQENVSSGSMAALLQSMAIEFNSNLERAWVLNLEKIGTHHLRIFQRMATDEQAISVCGEDNKWSTSTFRGEDVKDILRVSVKTASALSKTTAGRADIADKLLERGAINAQEYLRVIQTGKLDPMFQGPVGELTLIKSENERLSRGEEVAALIWDNPQLHIREHKSLLNTDLRGQPELIQFVNQHLDQHYALWGQMSREDPDRLAAIGCPPLPQALQIGMAAMAMQDPTGTMAQAPQAGPAMQKQPETEPTKSAPGPAPGPKGKEPSKAHPSEPQPAKPAKNPMTGEAVV